MCRKSLVELFPAIRKYIRDNKNMNVSIKYNNTNLNRDNNNKNMHETI